MARLAQYLRRSMLGEEDRNYSLDDQGYDVGRWNEREGHALVKTYADPGGKSYTLNRPVFQQMMADAKAGLFDILVVGRWDRFSRIQDQQAVATYQLQRYGVKVVSATQPVPDGPLGAIIRNGYSFAAELELYNIRDRTTGGKRARLRAGKLLASSFPLYGYLWADAFEPHGKSRYIPDPETAWVVQRIFDLIVSGEKLRRICQILEQDGIPTPGQVHKARGEYPENRPCSSIWRTGTLHKMIKNPAYMGQPVGWRHAMVPVEVRDPISGVVRERLRQVVRDESDADLVPLPAEACPALVSRETFEAVQVILKRNQEQAYRNMKDPEQGLLRDGIALCGYCNRHMVLKYLKDGGYYRYMCASTSSHHPCAGGRFTWKAQRLDDVAWRWLMHKFENPDVVRRKFEQWQAERDDGLAIEYDQIDAYEKQIRKAQLRKRNFMDSAGDSDNEEMRVEWRAKAEEEDRHIRSLTKSVEQLKQVLAHQEKFDQAVEDITALGTAARKHLEQATFDDKRITLQAFKVHMLCFKKEEADPYTISWGFDELHEHWVRQRFGYVSSDKCVRSV